MISAVNSDKNGKVNIKVLQFSDGWWSFPDLNTLDSDVLIAALTLHDSYASNSVWNPGKANKSSGHVTIASHRQMEALFNLSQLFFALCRADNTAKTFRDLQLDAPGHMIWDCTPMNKEKKCSIDYFATYRNLVSGIVENDGLEVIFMMFKKPIFPLVRQKCLDILTCMLLIPDVALRVLRTEDSFLRSILILVRDHSFVESKIPAISVLLRLSDVIVDYSLVSQYMHIVEMQFIDFVLDILNKFTYRNDDELQFFLKFEALALQNCTRLLSDEKLAERWSDIAQERLTNYCVKQLHLCVTEDPLFATEQKSLPVHHILAAEAKRFQHGLCYTVTTFTALARANASIAEFYRKNRYFPHLLSLVARKYGPNSPTFPFYSDVTRAVNSLVKHLFPSWLNNPRLSHLFASKQRIYARCANPSCRKSHSNEFLLDGKFAKFLPASTFFREWRILFPECSSDDILKVSRFRRCKGCRKPLYCSTFCRNVHFSEHSRTCNKKSDDEEYFVDGLACQGSKTASSESSDNNKMQFNDALFEPCTKIVEKSNKLVASTPPCKKLLASSPSSCTNSSLMNCKESPIKKHLSKHKREIPARIPFSFDTVRYEDSDGECLIGNRQLTRISPPAYGLCNTAEQSASSDLVIESNNIIINKWDGLSVKRSNGKIKNGLLMNGYESGRRCLSLESLKTPIIRHRSMHDIRNKLKRCVIS